PSQEGQGARHPERAQHRPPTGSPEDAQSRRLQHIRGGETAQDVREDTTVVCRRREAFRARTGREPAECRFATLAVYGPSRSNAAGRLPKARVGKTDPRAGRSHGTGLPPSLRNQAGREVGSRGKCLGSRRENYEPFACETPAPRSIAHILSAHG